MPHPLRRSTISRVTLWPSERRPDSRRRRHAPARPRPSQLAGRRHQQGAGCGWRMTRAIDTTMLLPGRRRRRVAGAGAGAAAEMSRWPGADHADNRYLIIEVMSWRCGLGRWRGAGDNGASLPRTRRRQATKGRLARAGSQAVEGRRPHHPSDESHCYRRY